VAAQTVELHPQTFCPKFSALIVEPSCIF